MSDFSGLKGNRVLVVTATCDCLRDEGRELAKKLEEAGVQVTALEGPGSHCVAHMLDNDFRDETFKTFISLMLPPKEDENDEICETWGVGDIQSQRLPGINGAMNEIHGQASTEALRSHLCSGCAPRTRVEKRWKRGLALEGSTVRTSSATWFGMETNLASALSLYITVYIPPWVRRSTWVCPENRCGPSCTYIGFVHCYWLQ